MWRRAIAGALVVAGMAAAPAQAQFFFQSRDLSGAPVTGEEPGIAERLPGATAAELRANLVWNMRAALNVAALQCQFEPTLLTVENYNAVLRNHRDELKGAFDTLGKYFARVNKTTKAGQTALDQYGTRTYSSFSIVAAQYNFCETAAAIGRDAKYATRGGFGTVAAARSRELRNSLTPYGEQRFPFHIGFDKAALPRLDAICWDKKVRWQTKKCGTFAWPPTGTTAVAAAR
jgi:hypothetical protein